MFRKEQSAGSKELLDAYCELYPENQKFVLAMIKHLLENQQGFSAEKNQPAPPNPHR